MAEKRSSPVVTQNTKFDVAVIGGGINGAAIAHLAACFGHSVVLCEKGDFAAGTSSRSSRLIHGGVRYLEHGLLQLVFESSRERRALARMVPHLARPLRFLWPSYSDDRIPLWKLRAGLTLYDALALFRNFHSHRSLRAAEVLAAEPQLARDGLAGGVTYFDAATDDARLTLANVLAARDLGARVLNYTEVIGIDTRRDSVVLTARDNQSDERITLEAALAVNAAGPWSDAVSRMVDPSRSGIVRGTRGTHVAVARERLPTNGAVTALAPQDGRVFFILPSLATSIISTTEVETADPPDEVRPSGAEVDYLLDATNHRFPDARLQRSDVVSAWAGIRPLAARHFTGEGASTSREHQLVWVNGRVLAISGGKLTTYRVVARDVLRLIGPRIRAARAGSRMCGEELPGGGYFDLAAQLRAAGDVVPDPDVARQLVFSYGSRWRDVWRLTADDPALRRRTVDALPFVDAQVVYAARHELARTLSDVLFRRTHLAFELRDHGASLAPHVASLMMPELRWNAAQVHLQVDLYRDDVSRMFSWT